MCTVSHFVYISDFYNLFRNEVPVREVCTSVLYDVLCHVICSTIPELDFAEGRFFLFADSDLY